MMAQGPRPNLYPSWPQSFPPDAQKEGAPMNRPVGQRPPGQVVQLRSPYSPVAQAYPTWIQPAGYVTQAPSYWYGR